MTANATLDHLSSGIVRRLNRRLGGGALAQAGRWLRRRFKAAAPEPCQVLPYNENATALRVRGGRADEIAGLWRELVCADTGEPVVESIDHLSRDRRGALAADLPDLLIRCRPGITPRAVRSASLGLIEGDLPELRPGNHGRGRGLCLLAGPAARETVGAVEDLGPLAARLLDVPAKAPRRTRARLAQ